jgi:hypothetical protein
MEGNTVGESGMVALNRTGADIIVDGGYGIAAVDGGRYLNCGPLAINKQARPKGAPPEGQSASRLASGHGPA